MRKIAFLLSLAFVFTIPWENAITVGGLGTLTRVIGLLMVTVWLGSAPKAGFRKPHPFQMVIFLFILWNVASFFWSVGVDETVQRIKTYIQLFILAWILWDLYTTPKAVRAALEAYILGAYVTIISTIHNYYAGQETSAYAWGRYAGASLNANDQALILALGLPVAWYLATFADNGIKDNIIRTVNYVYILGSLFAIILTGSRMGLFVVVPGIFYIIGTANQLKSFSRILIFAVFLGSLVGMQHYIPDATMERLATVGESIANRDLGGRMILYRKSIAVFSKHPVLGIGSGALRTDSELGTVAHNTFFSVLSELGLIGFSLFVLMLAIAVYETVNQPKQFFGLYLTVLAIWTIGVCALTWEFSKSTWLFLSMIVISANLYRERYSINETKQVSVGRFD